MNERDSGSISGHDEEDTHDEWIRELWAAEVTKYDRTVLAFSGGALALSVTLIRSVSSVPSWKWLLGSGWLARLASVFFILLSYAVSKSAIEAQWNDEDDESAKKGKKAWGLSLTAGWLLLAGSIQLAAFAWFNLGSFEGG